MSHVLVLGAGLMGPAIAGDIFRFGLADRVVITDVDARRLRAATDYIRWAVGDAADGRLEAKPLDLRDRRALVEEMRQADAVAGAYPVAMVREVTEAAVEAGTHLCDLTGSAEGFDVFAYDEPARRAGMVILPGCGVAPGLTNVLAGQGAARLDEPEEGVLYVGGLPAERLPPLEYRVVFSLDTVIDEYCAPVLIVQDGRTTVVPALDGLEELTFPDPVGRCEAFYTYGLGTLARTGVELGYRYLAEKTVRYPGHRDKVLFLRECGLFSQEPVEVDGVRVVPRRVTAAVLEPLLRRGGEADITVLRAVVRGRKGGRRVEWVFEMVDRYDPVLRATSMARTTGYMCSVIVGMLLAGRIPERGVAPLERVFADAGRYAELVRELARRGIVVTERSRELPGAEQ